MKIIKAWGFTYNTIAFVWVKETQGKDGKIITECDEASERTCEDIEFCLFATKGNIQPVNAIIPQVIPYSMEENRVKPNYVKPELFKKLTVQLLGDRLTL